MARTLLPVMREISLSGIVCSITNSLSQSCHLV